MAEVPPHDHLQPEGEPATPGDSPAGESVPPIAPPPRGPFDDFFSDRLEPSDTPIRTPWDPPPWRSSDQPEAGAFDPLWPSAGAPGTAYPWSDAEATAAAPPARRSILRPAGRLVRELAETTILALVIFLLVRAVVQNFQVEGRSMEPTLESGWYLLVNKALYWEVDLDTVDKFLPFIDSGDDPTRYIFRGPRRGDVIVFRAPDSTPGAPERDFIKRVVGLPGDTVEIKDCTVFVNGEALEESYILAEPAYTYPIDGSGPVTVPDGHYFVLGDNRNNSADSHTWGMLPKENIIGQAWVIYWPFGHFGLLNDDKPGVEDPAAAAAKQTAAVCPTS
jgi:signal peptidase I